MSNKNTHSQHNTAKAYCSYCYDGVVMWLEHSKMFVCSSCKREIKIVGWN